MKKSFILAIALLAFAGSAFAQGSASTTGTASAWTIRPVAITNCGDLAFGNIIGSANGGTVSISNTGVVTYNTAGDLKPGTQTGTTSAACFCATGEGGFAVNIGPAAGTVVVITRVPPGSPGVGFVNSLNVTLTGPSGGAVQNLSGILHDGDRYTDPSDMAPGGADPINNQGAEDQGSVCWNVGGTLTLQASPNQAFPGYYSGTWLETVAYN